MHTVMRTGRASGWLSHVTEKVLRGSHVPSGWERSTTSTCTSGQTQAPVCNQGPDLTDGEREALPANVVVHHLQPGGLMRTGTARHQTSGVATTHTSITL